VSREEFPFYYLPTGKAQNAALREVKSFIRVRLLKLQNTSETIDPCSIESCAERVIDLLKPSFSKRGSIMQYTTLDEYSPINDVKVLRKIYSLCIG
jgi:hypothetical protein